MYKHRMRIYLLVNSTNWLQAEPEFVGTLIPGILGGTPVGANPWVTGGVHP